MIFLEVLGAILVSILAAMFLFPLAISRMILHRLMHYPRSVPSAPRVPRRKGSFLSFPMPPDGSTLPLAVLLPGAGAGAPSMDQAAAVYRSQGFEVMVLEYPDSNQREGPLGWGPPEAEELASFIKTQTRPILIHGRSFGASVALVAWALSGKEATVVAESGFCSLPEVLEYQTLRPYRWMRPFRIWVRIGIALAFRKAALWGIRAGDNKPLENLKGASGTLLLLHGTRDRMVPPWHSTTLHAAAMKHGIPCRLTFLQGGRHSRLREAAPEVWEDALKWATLAACGKSNLK